MLVVADLISTAMNTLQSELGEFDEIIATSLYGFVAVLVHRTF